MEDEVFIKESKFEVRPREMLCSFDPFPVTIFIEESYSYSINYKEENVKLYMCIERTKKSDIEGKK